MFYAGDRLTGTGKRTYSTSFNTVENPLRENGNWVEGLTDGLDWADMRVSSAGVCIGTQTGSNPLIYDDSTALVGGAWAADQYAEVTIFNNEISGAWNSECEVRLRSVITAHVNRGYEFNLRVKNSATPYVEIIRWNGPIGPQGVGFDPLLHVDSSGFANSTGTVLSARAIGSALHVYVNGVEVSGSPVTDTTWATGNPGMGTYLNNQGATGDVSRFGITHFSAVEL